MAPTPEYDVDLDNVDAARRVIDPMFLDTAQFSDDMIDEALGRHAVLKLETSNPIRSFKGRGVGFALSTLSRGTTVVCASSGNFGQAVAFVGRCKGLTVEVFTTTSANAAKTARMERLGARVHRVRGDLAAARLAAEAAAEGPGRHLLADGSAPAIAEGAATIAAELLDGAPFDSIAVPVGDGSLISGIGAWLRVHAPRVRVIGVNPARTPTMRNSLRAGQPLTIEVVAPFAEGISIPRPREESLRRVAAVVDEVVVVTDEELLDAMALAARHLSVLLEPAGAAGLAALAAGRVPGERVAVVLTGANPSSSAIAAVTDRLRRQDDVA